MTDQKEQPMIP